jgi:hypothetical protein
MKTAAVKLQRFAVGILAVLSLSVSSVAACACSHHEAGVQPEQSCHSTASHHSKPKTAPTGHHVSESCVCVLSAAKLSVKAEGFKLKKHEAASSAGTSIESTRFYSAAVATATAVDPQSYSSSFYNSTAARGPPLT